MAVTLRMGLAIAIWLGAVFIQGILMDIARFFKRTTGKLTGYQLYWISILLTTVGLGRYIARIPGGNPSPDFVGDPFANLALCVAGLLLLALGNRLHELMVEESPQ